VRAHIRKDAIIMKTSPLGLVLLSASISLAGCAFDGTTDPIDSPVADAPNAGGTTDGEPDTDTMPSVPGKDDSAGAPTAAARPTFEVFRSSGSFYFHLTAANHEVMLASEGYETRMGALGGVLAVLDDGGDLSSYDIREATNGQFYFNIEAGNHEIIATSELYTTRSNAVRAAETVVAIIGDYVAFLNARTGARFELFEGGAGHYFRLYAANGEIVMGSEAYSSAAAALNGAFAVADYGLDAANYEVVDGAHGSYFNLRATNGEIIGTSEMYASRGNAVRGVDDIIALLADIEIL
jgi:hypothetical protein